MILIDPYSPLTYPHLERCGPIEAHPSERQNDIGITNPYDDKDDDIMVTVNSVTLRAKTPCGRCYVTVTQTHTPEVQLYMSGMDPCMRSWVGALQELINRSTQSHRLSDIARSLTGLKCHKGLAPIQNQGVSAWSCADVIGQTLIDADRLIKERERHA